MISSPSTSTAPIPTNKTRSDLQPSPQSKWRTGAQQRIYGRRLLEALKIAHNGTTSCPQAIKDAADSALALTARGQTRWSRSLLFARSRRRKVLLKTGGKIRRRRPPRPPPRKPIAELSIETSPSRKKVRDRLRVLSRLVPGCRKVSTPNLLEEAADYVGALQMQVKTMRALADALSAAALSSPIGDSGPGV